jgi:hypothetical protein
MLLLKAALGDGPQALAAWESWMREEGLDHPDFGSFRLLPLVFRNLAAHGYQGAQFGTLRGIHRQAWSRNQVLFHQVRPFLEEARAAGTPLLLLKGAALAFQVYPDAGCRPMSDVDVLVPASAARGLWEKVESAGWRAACWRPRTLHESYFRFRHAMDFESPQGGRVDLHWHALSLCCHSRGDELFWQNAEPLEFQGLPVQTCSPTAHLLNLCAHGIVWNNAPPVRWIADAVLLLRRFPNPEWGRLVEASAALDIVPYMLRALAFLRSHFDVPVPVETLRLLERISISAAVAAEFGRESEPFAARTAREDLLAFYARWRRSLGGASPLLNSPGFLRYLQYAFELEGTPALATQLVRSALRRMTARQPSE